jgi:arylmalonate decarboxylase
VIEETRRRFLKLIGLGAASALSGSAADPVLGLIFAASTVAIPADALALYPAGIRFLAEGVGIGRTLPEGFDTLAERVIPVAKKLANAGANAVLLMSPPLSFYKGARFDRSISDEITRVTGLTAITASTAIVEALRTLRARRLAVATAYTDEISLHLQGFLEQSGFEVVTVRGLGIERFEERGTASGPVTVEEILEFNVRVRESRPEADALLIAHGDLPTLGMIVELEKRCQIPVVAATPHALRAGVRLLGLNGRAAGFGTLLDR